MLGFFAFWVYQLNLMCDTDGLLNPPNISRACGLNLVDPGTFQGDGLAEQAGQDGDGSNGVLHVVLLIWWLGNSIFGKDR